ncbi:sugar ABC transporter permease [Vibrio splendidus]|uniref:sugar ABC transporter permease n=1 Tax=Vibrio splendidus TaxID=29497 RepID=UPI00097800CE|nr:sugar ABC transporter permease [Vibrio splendidus]OMO27073.1 sugar ABC transporter permease [Vibrio splendidus]PMH07990.1 sugar ABC transporter permease [Vibrio splendidus]PMI82197.1 sugar ABC transporter permease [Vibrio splendidus]PMK17893.1 sugar ABC transporter permease [Vibrio splendidus]PMK57185.1 sugar ABC transporter permease [Vibrio splendidus]
MDKAIPLERQMKAKRLNRHVVTKNIGVFFCYAFLISMSVIILYPILVTLMSAFNVSNSLYSTSFFPENFSLTKNFVQLFNDTPYLSWYRNTFLVSIITMILSTFIVTISGFVYSRYRYQSRKSALVSLLVIQIIPSGSGLIALYAIANSIGIYSSANATLYTYIFMILIYTTGGITMNTILMKGYYDSIPRALDESAKIDGATQMQIFKEILLPLVKPMIMVIAIFCFLGPIGDIIMPKFLIASMDSEAKTLAVGLMGLINNIKESSYNVFAAGAVLAAIPPVIVFYKFQDYIVGGLTSGGVKG